MTIESNSTWNWQEIAATSHYQTAEAVKTELLRGNIEEATLGIEELVDALGRSERRAIESQLERLMLHVLKWKSQPERRSRSWRASILNARHEIRKIRKDTPGLNETAIQSLWNDAFLVASRSAEAEMNQDCEIERLTWKEVFEDDYELP